MFFVLSKLLDILVDPLWFGGLPAVVGAVLLARGKQAGRLRNVALALLFGGLSVVSLCALPACSNRLWASLESDAAKTLRPEVTYDAVVLLGGTVSPAGSLADAPAWNDNVERLLEVRQLLVTGRAKLAIVTGGPLNEGLRTEAEYLRDELVLLGVPREQVVLEPKALNTKENAVESKKLLEAMGAKSVLVVTSAFHMKRAVGCFRAVGVEADFLPVDFRLRDPAEDQHWLPRAEYLGQTSRVLRELLGRLVYRVLGYTK